MSKNKTNKNNSKNEVASCEVIMSAEKNGRYINFYISIDDFVKVPVKLSFYSGKLSFALYKKLGGK